VGPLFDLTITASFLVLVSACGRVSYDVDSSTTDSAVIDTTLPLDGAVPDAPVDALVDTMIVSDASVPLAIPVGVEVPVATVMGVSTAPAAVWNGRELAIAWEVERADRDILFTRLDADGVEIGSALVIAEAPNYQGEVQLTWTGTEYGLAWHDHRDDPDVGEIYFQRMDASGALIGPTSVVVTSIGDGHRAAMEWTGSEHALVWQDERTGNRETFFARISPDGTRPDVPSEVSVSRMSAVAPDLVVGDDRLGVVWDDSRDGNREIYFRALSPTGGLLSGEVRITNATNVSGEPAIAWNGSVFGIAWEDRRDGDYDVYFTTVSADGAVMTPELALTADGRASRAPHITWTGTSFAVAWADAGQIVVAELDPSGTRGAADVTVMQSSGANLPFILPTGDAVLVCYQDDRSGANEIFVYRVR